MRNYDKLIPKLVIHKEINQIQIFLSFVITTSNSITWYLILTYLWLVGNLLERLIENLAPILTSHLLFNRHM